MKTSKKAQGFYDDNYYTKLITNCINDFHGSYHGHQIRQNNNIFET